MGDKHWSQNHKRESGRGVTRPREPDEQRREEGGRGGGIWVWVPEWNYNGKRTEGDKKRKGLRGKSKSGGSKKEVNKCGAGFVRGRAEKFTLLGNEK